MGTSRSTTTSTPKSSKSWTSKLWSVLRLDWLRPRKKRATIAQPAGKPPLQQREGNASSSERPHTPAHKAVNSQVYFSPGNDCLDAIIAQIHGARKSLDICVFTISDDRIAEAIIACHRSRVPVRIVTDNEKLLDQGSDIERMARAGITVRIDRTEAHMHHKFAVIDGRVAVTGSYNWTRSAAIYNMENVLVTSEAGVIAGYAKEFERLWRELDEF